MRFNKVRLNGFKGFAEPTEITIHDGLTGIVGPNGCGKSNLVEALGWVMGENRPSAMRGEAMDNVIFEGTKTRPPNAHAEVALEVERSPEEAGGEKTEISRRVERAGGSVFRIDGQEARWRDIQILFDDSAIGPRSAALVRQGQISELVNARPLSRSGILEGAAGIAGLARRRREAELKLNATEVNLTRVEDILGHLETRVSQLSRQARQARRYRLLGEKIRNAQTLLDYLRWIDVDHAAKDAESRSNKCLAETASAQAAANKAERAQELAEENLHPLREAAAVAGAALQRIRAEQDLVEEQARRAAEAARSFSASVAQLTLDIERETGLQAEAESKIKELERQNRILEAEGEGYSEQLSAAESALAKILDKLEGLEEAHAEASARAAELASRRAMAEQAIADAERLHAECESRGKSAEDALAAARRNLEIANEHREARAVEYADASRAAEQGAARLHDAEATRSAARNAATVARSERAEADERLAVLGSEAKELERLLARGGVEQDSTMSNLSVQPGMEVALGAALGSDLFAPEANGHVGGWTELPELARPPALPKGVEPLTAYVSGPGYLSRRLSQTGLAEPDHIATAREALEPGQRLVTRKGDLCRWDGFSAGGSDTPAALRLEQLNRFKEVRSEISDAEQVIEKAQQIQDIKDGRAAQADEIELAARQERRDADEAMAMARLDLSAAETEVTIAQSRLKECETACTEAYGNIESASAARLEAGANAGNLEKSGRASDDSATLRNKAALARQDMLDARAMRDGLIRDNNARSDRLERNAHEICEWQSRHKSAGTRIAQLEVRQKENFEAGTAARLESERLHSGKKDFGNRIQSAEHRNSEAAALLGGAEAELRRCKQVASAATVAASEKREERARIEALAEGSAQALEAAVGKIREVHRCEPHELSQRLDFDRNDPPEIAGQEIDLERFMRSREALGAVNLRAEQEVAELESEYRTLNEEKEDLQAAVQDLRSSINNLNREGRQRLHQKFESVDRNFSELFCSLFGGGSARLELVEGDDPLESGLEILCNPPGKRFSTLSLLSGGEQTLTAVALTFAFFVANPTPICVLDEVDAPLDDANVVRFCDLIKDVSQRTGTRFLIVTHHPTTMARMDRLFGVTMQERGVSRIVSVDLGEAERMVA